MCDVFSLEGQLSAQRVVRQVKREKNASESVASFTEELVVRRELADNFCFYNHNYDDISGECCVTRFNRTDNKIVANLPSYSWPLFKYFFISRHRCVRLGEEDFAGAR